METRTTPERREVPHSHTLPLHIFSGCLEVGIDVGGDPGRADSGRRNIVGRIGRGRLTTGCVALDLVRRVRAMEGNWLFCFRLCSSSHSTVASQKNSRKLSTSVVTVGERCGRAIAPSFFGQLLWPKSSSCSNTKAKTAKGK